MRHPWLWIVPTVVVAVALVGVAVASVGRGAAFDPPAVTDAASTSPTISPTPTAPPQICTAAQLDGTVVYRPSVASPSFQSKDGAHVAEQFPFELEVVNVSASECVMLSSPMVAWTRTTAKHSNVVMALTDAVGQVSLPAGAGVFAAVEVGVPPKCAQAQAADDGTLALTLVQGRAPLHVALHRLAECAASGPMVVWPFTLSLTAADHDLQNAGWVVDPRGIGTD